MMAAPEEANETDADDAFMEETVSEVMPEVDELPRVVAGPLARLLLCDSGMAQVLISIECFQRYFTSGAGMTHLFERVARDAAAMDGLAEKCMLAGEFDGLWLLFLQECEGTEAELLVITELIEAFRGAKKIPTGLRLKTPSWGYFPLNAAALEASTAAAHEALHVVFVMLDDYCTGRLGPVDEGSARIAFIKATLANEKSNSMLRFLSTRAAAFLVGVQVDCAAAYKVSLDTSATDFLALHNQKQMALLFLDLAFSSFATALRSFHHARLALRESHKLLFQQQERESDCLHAYNVMLFELSGEDDEDKLPVSIQHYLKDNDELRLLYKDMNKAKEVVILSKQRYHQEQLSCMHLVPTVRFSAALLVHLLGIIMPGGVDPGPQQDLPLVERVEALLLGLQWNTFMKEFYEVERQIYGAVYTRILAVLACIMFPEMQNFLSADEFVLEGDENTAYDPVPTYHEKVTSPCIVRKALNDLVNPNIEWSVTPLKLFPQVEPWLVNQTLHRPIRCCRVDTRIATALVYWAGHRNAHVQARIRDWRASILPDVDSPLMWKQLIVRSDKSMERAVFPFEDGSVPRFQREYKEYYEELADTAMYEFLLLENENALKRESDLDEQVQNPMKLCSDKRVSAWYGNAFAKNFLDTLLTNSPFHFEGNIMKSLRGQHPLNIVAQLSSSCCNSVDSVAKQVFVDHETHVKALFRIIESSREVLTPKEDGLLLNVAMQVLANIMQGPFPIQRSPSFGPLFQENVMQSAFPLARQLLRDLYQGELRSCLQLATDIMFRAAIEDLCPMGVLANPLISTAIQLVSNITLVLPVEEVMEVLSSACIDHLDVNFWHVATTSVYERFQVEEDEREEADADKGDPAMVARYAARKEQKRQCYANFFLFVMEGGLFALANHLIKERKWNLPAPLLAAFWTDLDLVSDEFRVLVLELINIVSGESEATEILTLMLKQTNFLSLVMLESMSQAAQDLPELAMLQQSARYFDRTPALLRLRIGEQIMRLAKGVVNCGRVDGRVPHMSVTNEFMLYFALADGATSLQSACEILAYAGSQMQAISLSCCEPRHQFTNHFPEEAAPSRVLLPSLPDHLPVPSDRPTTAAEAKALSAHTHWDKFIQYYFFTKMRDTAFFAVEFLHQLCVGRLELQTKMQKTCAPVFEQLPRFLSLTGYLGNRVSLLANNTSKLFRSDRYFHFHVALSRNVCVLISALCYRHEGCTGLVQEKGGMVGLCAAMNDCANGLKYLGKETQRTWSECITSTIENIVSRNIDAWAYCQHVSGVDGLFTLTLLGNNTIKKLCMSTMLDHATEEENGQAYMDEVVAKNGIDTFRRLLYIQDDEELILVTLRLIKIIVISSRSFRSQAFSEAQKDFFGVLTKMLVKKHLEIQGVVCAIFDYFCAEDANAIRDELLKYNALKHLVAIASMPTHSGDTDESQNTQDLAQAAARTMANLTVSDESEFLDGSAPLRPTLGKSGILPTLRNKHK